MVSIHSNLLQKKKKKNKEQVASEMKKIAGSTSRLK